MLKGIRSTPGFGKAKIGCTKRHETAGIRHKQGASLRKKVHGVNQYWLIYPLDPKMLPHKDAGRFL